MSETLYRPRLGSVPLTDDRLQYRKHLREYSSPGEYVAFDTERASGIRYLDKAYLIQAKGQFAPLVLLDPLVLDDLSDFSEACKNSTWVLHAAKEDLECMEWAGLQAPRLFDTQIAAKLLGYEHVGLGAVTEEVLGVKLAKNHTRENWSLRPLKQSWLDYAALDVEYLVELALALKERLEAAGRLAWAEQEFSYTLAHYRRQSHPEPWRQVKGAGKARSPRQLGLLRELYSQRDEIARERDVAPHRVLPNRDLVDLVLQTPRSYQELSRRPFMKRRQPRRYARRWWQTIKKVRDLEKEQLPGREPPRKLHEISSLATWEKIDPARAELYRLLKENVSTWAQENQIWAELALSPSAIRQVAAYWEPSQDLQNLLKTAEARDWQLAHFQPRFEQLCSAWTKR
ncbi:HRDC domain-containing protein [Varibaculum cambriense]|uniref:HRDC domain-containing protein n=1 Tax=Varibaculum cambriense TaxID=184870 RepID=UPI00290326BB|nr:HRDC domain-containing protein [Varibaculum cambriense]MDU1225075.1 HRDC domain-containing protein [Varibaculum cambriense]